MSNLKKEAEEYFLKKPMDMMEDLLEMANKPMMDFKKNKTEELSYNELFKMNVNNIDMIKHLLKYIGEQQIVLVEKANKNNKYILRLTIIMILLALIQITPIIFKIFKVICTYFCNGF